MRRGRWLAQCALSIGIAGCNSHPNPSSTPGRSMVARLDAGADASPLDAAVAAEPPGRCPSTVAGAHTIGRDVRNGIAIEVTATAADAVAAIRERAHRVYAESHYFRVAMEPPGSMQDDFFSDAYDAVTPGKIADLDGDPQVVKIAPACPIRVRFVGVQIDDTAGGVTITMTVTAKEASSLRNIIRARIARLPP